MNNIDERPSREQGPDTDRGQDREKTDDSGPAETIDWNLVWIENQRRCTESVWVRECWQSWEDEAAAQEYLEMARSRPVSRQRAGDIFSLVKADWRVLDIGAGPGNIAVPLSALCSHVSAVEPAGGMALMLNRQIETGKISNVRLVNKKWDDVIPVKDLSPPYDLTFASFSLGMKDIRASIVKMLSVTSREIVIFWHAGLRSWDRYALELWPLLHGVEYHPCPQSDVLFNVLYSMGIYPDVRVLRSNSEIVYQTFEEAFDRFASRYEVVNDRQRGILKTYLERRLLKKSGKLLLPRSDTAMRFSWEVADCYAE
jgi:ubiquinone/menaquinone biosynthesis C-methylase UbiE